MAVQIAPVRPTIDNAEEQIHNLIYGKPEVIQRIRDIVNQGMRHVRPDVHVSFPPDQWNLIVNYIAFNTFSLFEYRLIRRSNLKH